MEALDELADDSEDRLASFIKYADPAELADEDEDAEEDMRSVERHSSEQYVSPSFVCFSQTRHQSQSTPSIGDRYGICGEGKSCVGVGVCVVVSDSVLKLEETR